MTAHRVHEWSRDLRINAQNLCFIRCRSPRRGALYGIRDMLGWGRGERPLRTHESLVLEGVDLTLRRGEALGIVGPNGAGKSTLIKLLAGLIEPARGSVELHGKIEAIIELGGGLDPFLSGRENAKIGGRLRGFFGARARAYVEQVEEFAEIGAAFDAPVCTYSTGMQARVAFAIAAAAGPDILLVDEALAVGDHGFQRRCIQFINRLLSRGGSVVFVSHNCFQVQSLCHRGLVLDEGRAVFSGTAVEAVRTLLDLSRRTETAARLDDSSGHLRLVRFCRPGGGPPTCGEQAELVVEYSLTEDREDVSWGFELWTPDEQICVTSAQDLRRRVLRAGAGELRCVFDPFPLTGGSYLLKLNLSDLLIVAPLVLGGRSQSSDLVEVHASPTAESNFHVHRGQLTTVNVNWS